MFKYEVITGFQLFKKLCLKMVYVYRCKSAIQINITIVLKNLFWFLFFCIFIKKQKKYTMSNTDYNIS